MASKDKGGKETKKPKKSSMKAVLGGEFMEANVEPTVIKKGKKRE